MKSKARVYSPARAGFFALALLISCAVGAAYTQNEPILVPDAVDYQKLLPILPDAPQGWIADKPDGSTEDVPSARDEPSTSTRPAGESRPSATAATPGDRALRGADRDDDDTQIPPPSIRPR